MAGINPVDGGQNSAAATSALAQLFAHGMGAGSGGVQSGFGAAQDAARLAQQQQNAQAQTKLEDLLKTQRTARDLQSAKDVSSDNPNASVRVGEASIGHDDAARLAHQNLISIGVENNKVNTLADKLKSQYEPQINRLTSAMQGLQSGSTIGMTRGLTGLAGLSSGGAASKSIVPILKQYDKTGSLQGSIQNVQNFITGNPDVTKSPQFIKDVHKALSDAATNLTSEYNAEAQAFPSKAANIAPIAAAQTPGFTQNAMGLLSGLNMKTQALQALQQSGDKMFSSPQPSPGNTPSPAPTILQRLAGALGPRTGAPSPQAAPQGPQNAPQNSPQNAPQAPQGFDPNAFLNGK